jgi:hypothetical protein
MVLYPQRSLLCNGIASFRNALMSLVLYVSSQTKTGSVVCMRCSKHSISANTDANKAPKGLHTPTSVSDGFSRYLAPLDPPRMHTRVANGARYPAF